MLVFLTRAVVFIATRIFWPLSQAVGQVFARSGDDRHFPQLAGG